MSVNWNEPIEAVNRVTGEVVPMELARGPEKDYWGGQSYYTKTSPSTSTSNNGWHEDGGDHCSHNQWYIRNVPNSGVADELAQLRQFREIALLVAPELAQMPKSDEEMVEFLANAYYESDDADLPAIILAAMKWAK